MPENLGIQLIQWLFSDKLINPAAFVEAPGVMDASGLTRDTRDRWMISLCSFTAGNGWWKPYETIINDLFCADKPQ